MTTALKEEEFRARYTRGLSLVQGLSLDNGQNLVTMVAALDPNIGVPFANACSFSCQNLFVLVRWGLKNSEGDRLRAVGKTLIAFTKAWAYMEGATQFKDGSNGKDPQLQGIQFAKGKTHVPNGQDTNQFLEFVSLNKQNLDGALTHLVKQFNTKFDAGSFALGNRFFSGARHDALVARIGTLEQNLKALTKKAEFHGKRIREMGRKLLDSESKVQLFHKQLGQMGTQVSDLNSAHGKLSDLIDDRYETYKQDADQKLADIQKDLQKQIESHELVTKEMWHGIERKQNTSFEQMQRDNQHAIGAAIANTKWSTQHLSLERAFVEIALVQANAFLANTSTEVLFRLQELMTDALETLTATFEAVGKAYESYEQVASQVNINQQNVITGVKFIFDNVIANIPIPPLPAVAKAVVSGIDCVITVADASKADDEEDWEASADVMSSDEIGDFFKNAEEEAGKGKISKALDGVYNGLKEWGAEAYDRGSLFEVGWQSTGITKDNLLSTYFTKQKKAIADLQNSVRGALVQLGRQKTIAKTLVSMAKKKSNTTGTELGSWVGQEIREKVLGRLEKDWKLNRRLNVTNISGMSKSIELCLLAQLAAKNDAKDIPNPLQARLRELGLWEITGSSSNSATVWQKGKVPYYGYNPGAIFKKNDHRVMCVLLVCAAYAYKQGWGKSGQPQDRVINDTQHKRLVRKCVEEVHEWHQQTKTKAAKLSNILNKSETWKTGFQTQFAKYGIQTSIIPGDGEAEL